MKLKNSIFCLCLLACCFLNCGGDDSPSTDRAVNFEFFWNTIDREYSYFQHKGIDWDAVRDEFEPRINEGLTNRQLFNILDEIIQQIGDGHTAIRTSFGNAVYQGYRGEVDNSVVNPGSYLNNVSTNNSRLLIGDITGKNVKYMAVRSLSGNIEDATNTPLYDAVSTLSGYDGLIIDLRNNGGGNDGIAKRFVQSFADQQRDIRRFRFRQPTARDAFTNWETDRLIPDNSISYTSPIVVLTNRYVVSSAEGFTLMLRALPNVTILGDTTAGSTGNPGLFEMPNGWELLVSRWQVTDPEGKFIEDQGIAPDEVVWITEEDRDAGRDTILEAAISKF